MERLGLVAGGGDLPKIFIRSVKEAGDKLVVFALKDIAAEDLNAEADRIHWLEIGQYKKFALLLLTERIRKLVLVGKVDKNVIYQKDGYDKEGADTLKNLKDKRNQNDYSILEEITKHLQKVGVEVIDGMKYLAHLLPEKGVLTKIQPDEKIKADIEYGFDMAKKTSGMDIGQTVIVKDKTIVAIEAMEGTDRAIERAYEVAGEGCCMVKVSRPNQDPRWDVPTVGPETMIKLSENKFRALAIENGKMFLIDKEKLVSLADTNNIVVEAV